MLNSRPCNELGKYTRSTHNDTKKWIFNSELSMRNDEYIILTFWASSHVFRGLRPSSVSRASSAVPSSPFPAPPTVSLPFSLRPRSRGASSQPTADAEETSRHGSFRFVAGGGMSQSVSHRTRWASVQLNRSQKTIPQAILNSTCPLFAYLGCRILQWKKRVGLARARNHGCYSSDTARRGLRTTDSKKRGERDGRRDGPI